MAETKTNSTPVAKPTWSIYKLVYKKGGMLQDFCFKYSDITAATEKAKEYCEKKKLRYVTCIEWLKDIQAMIEFETDENWRGK